jgi:hypothetical protein
MRDLERRLEHALARKGAPSGFADRVMDRLDEGRRRRRSGLVTHLSRIAAVFLVVAIGTGAWLQHQDTVRQKREAEEASMLVRLALHIATEKTNIARDHLTGSGSATKQKVKGENDHEATND